MTVTTTLKLLLAHIRVMVLGLLYVGHLAQAAENPPLPKNATPSDISKPAPKTILEQAKEHFGASRHAQAEKLLGKYISAHPSAPDAPECSLLLGQAQAKQKRLDEALRTYSGLLVHYPESEAAAKALEEKALLNIQRRNPAEAQKNREELLTKYPKSPTTARVWVNVADQFFLEEKFKEAASIYLKLKGNLNPTAEERLVLCEVLTQNGGNSQKILDAANSALVKNQISQAKILLKIISQRQESNAIAGESNVRYAWCLYWSVPRKSCTGNKLDRNLHHLIPGWPKPGGRGQADDSLPGSGAGSPGFCNSRNGGLQ